MSNTECTVTIADIYGAEWWERNKAELDREWEWRFGLVQPKEKYAIKYSRGITMNGHNEDGFPRIILHRRKPKPPTLREVYGVDEVTLPVGWEWTGEWRASADDSLWCLTPDRKVACIGSNSPRLILRERPKKVWFKCEAEPRVPRIGDWFYSYGAWRESTSSGDGVYLCATRHEEVDQTVQVVTQAMVDGVSK